MYYLVRAESWAYILFIHRSDKGGQFISYRKLALRMEAIVNIIQKMTQLNELWQVGLWIGQECEKFDDTKPLVEYLHHVWAKHRDTLRDLEQGNKAIESALGLQQRKTLAILLYLNFYYAQARLVHFFKMGFRIHKQSSCITEIGLVSLLVRTPSNHYAA